MKKILLLLLLSLMLLLSVTVAADESADIDKITNVIRLLEIMQGDENGNLNLEDNVTRAEFVKMSICASTYKKFVESAPKNTLFPDVRSDHWATRYVGLAITNGWINGYLDGTFRPDNNVRLEEAVNIVLKILGYTESDLAGAYPAPQMANYTSLELNKYIDALQGEYLTRRECMLLIYNMLNTENKNGTVHAQTLGYALDSNDDIDYLSVVEDKTDGPVLAGENWVNDVGIPAEKAVVWRDGKISDANAVKPYDVLYYSKLINTVWAYSEKEFGVLQNVVNAASPSAITLSGASYTLGNSDVKYKFSTLGDFSTEDIVVVLLGKDNKVEFAFDANELDSALFLEDENDRMLLNQYSKEDAFVVQDASSWMSNVPFDASGAQIIRDGVACDISAIQKYDVVYSSKLMNTVWAYSKKEFGVLQSVSGISSPSSIVLSGSNYTLANADVKARFSSLGDLTTDDIVVVLLGEDNKVEYAYNVYEVDYRVFVEDEVDYVLLTQYSLEDPFIAQDDTSWKNNIPFDVSTARVFKNGTPSAASEIKKYDVIYCSKLLNAIWCYDTKKSGIVSGVAPSKSTPATVNLSGASYSIAADSVSFALSELGTISEGDVVTLLLGRDNKVEGIITADAADSSLYMQGDLDYQQIVNASMEGPYIVNGNSHKTKIDFDLSTASIYRNDKEATAQDISEWDVYYYSKPLKTVWVYSKKISGKYESASPDKSAPSSVVVSGRTYAIETSGVAHQLSSAGSYAIGDNITLLIGKGGAIAGVVGADELSTEVVGLVTDFYSKEYETAYGSTYTSNCVVVSDLDGNTLEYPTSNTSMTKGKMVSVKTTSSGTKISVIAKSYTNVRDLNKAVADGKFADNAQLADMCGSSVYPILASRIENCVFDADDVLYYKLNSQGEVAILVLDDYTGDKHTYVIIESSVESVTTRGVSASYEYFGENGEGRIMTDTVFGAVNGPAAIEYSGNAVSKIENLRTGVALENVAALTALDFSGVTYDVWDRVKVYEQGETDYRLLNLNEIENTDKYSLVGWMDASPDNGGMIRIIIATPKR